MTEEYVVKSKFPGVGNVLSDFALEPVDDSLREGTQTRLVFRAEIHNGGVRGHLIHQRKRGREHWEDTKKIDLTRLRAGEGVHLELKTAQLARLVDVYDRLQAHLRDHRVRLGSHAYVSGNKDEVIVTDANMAAFVRQLLDRELVSTFLRDLSGSDPSLINRLAYGAAHLDRKNQLEAFRAFLEDPSRLREYADSMQQDSSKPEKIWQYFFERNSWIFGYGLDYKYLHIVDREATVSAPTVGNQEQEFLDFLMATSEYTVLVELKTPETPLFGNRKNRSRSWCLSRDLIDAESQILSQKASWQDYATKNQNSLYTNAGKTITEKTLNPDAILLIGSDRELHNCENDLERAIKERTFELHRRGLNNLQILRFDELYERAKHIAEVGEMDAVSRGAAPVAGPGEAPPTQRQSGDA